MKGPWEEFLRDVRFAWRQLRRSPGFTLASVLTLALGTGAATAIFSVVNGVLLQPLPYRDPEHLVQLFSVYEANLNSTVSGPNFLDWREQSRGVIADAALLNSTTVTLTGAGEEPERLPAVWTSSNLFSLLGTRALVGRTFTVEDAREGAPRVVVLSEKLWHRRFGGDRGVIGRTIRLSGQPHTVIGVVPRGAGFPLSSETSLWRPLVLSGDVAAPTNRGAYNFKAIGRLAPGVSLRQAQAATESIGRRLEEQYPDSNGGWGLRVEPLHQQMVVDVRTPLLLLLGAVGFVLLIACANVMNLLLVRAAGREAEMGIRAALGAGRGRILRQLLTESLALSVLGGVLGVVLATGLVRVLIALAPERIPRLDEVRIDAPVLLFATGLVFATVLICGLAPALQASRPDLARGLKQGTKGSQGRPGTRGLRDALVVVEVALAVMLLAGAGLLIRSFAGLMTVDLGFRPDQVTSFSFSLPDSKYPDAARLRLFTTELLERMQNLPGAQSAAFVFGLPFSQTRTSVGFDIEGAPPWPPGKTEVLLVRIVTPDYFRTLGIPLARGRTFANLDRDGSPKVVIINQAAVRRYFAGKDPLGQRIQLGWGPQGENLDGRVVGVVGDSKQYGIDQAPEPEIFVPFDQAPISWGAVVVRSTASPSVVASAARAQVRELDPDLPLSDLQALEDLVASSVARQRFYMLLLGLFAGIALALAAVGIYGVISYVVALRRREISIRMALGATHKQVLSMIVKQGLVLALAGTLGGILGALFVNRGMAGLLFEVSTVDPLALAGVVLLIFLIAVLASYLPARRATRPDLPLALREE